MAHLADGSQKGGRILPGEPGSGKGGKMPPLPPRKSDGMTPGQGRPMTPGGGKYGGNSGPMRPGGPKVPGKSKELTPTKPSGEVSGRVKMNSAKAKRQADMVKGFKANNGKMPSGMKKNIMTAAASKALS